MKYVYIIICIIFLGSCTTQEEKNIPVSQQDKQRENISEKVVSEEIIQNEVLGEKTEPEVKQEEEKIEYNTLSLATLMDEEINGYDLQLEQVLSENNVYTRYRIGYQNGDIYLSGIMNIPKGDGPFPLLVLNHGYIDTRYYTNGRGLKREQDYFARNGFAVIHPDYRNHAFSDKVKTEPYDFRLGYSRDVIASIIAVKKSDLPELETINTENIGMLGHSMGGGITQNIAVSKPDLIQAFILYGPVSNQEYLNFEKFQLSNPTRSSRVEQVMSDHKNPEENTLFWEGVSSQTFVKNIQAPAMIFTGTDDADTPTKWAQDIAQDLEKNEKQVTLVSYEGEGHEFIQQFDDFMLQSIDFYTEHLQKNK